jgi:large subunit ribosomal protein L21
MKYAIIEVTGKQILVEEGKHYITSRLPYKEGSTLRMQRVLLCSDNGKRLIGYPYLENVENIEIKATILEHFKGPKVTTLKMKPKKKTRWTRGHRQSHSRILIDKILTSID